MGDVIKRKHRCPACSEEFNMEITIKHRVHSSIRITSKKISRRRYITQNDERDDWPHATHLYGSAWF